MARLSDKQQRFVDGYLIDLNATQAAIRAGVFTKTDEQEVSRHGQSARSKDRAGEGHVP